MCFHEFVPIQKRNITDVVTSKMENHEVPKSLTSELDLYDKHQQGLVEAGEYEILMRDTILDNKSSIQTKNATWEHINGGDKKDAVSDRSELILYVCSYDFDILYPHLYHFFFVNRCLIINFKILNALLDSGSN